MRIASGQPFSLVGTAQQGATGFWEFQERRSRRFSDPLLVPKLLLYARLRF